MSRTGQSRGVRIVNALYNLSTAVVLALVVIQAVACSPGGTQVTDARANPVTATTTGIPGTPTSPLPPVTPNQLGADVTLVARTPTPRHSMTFSGARALEFARTQVEFGPRPTGSIASRKTGDYIISELVRAGWDVETEEFEFRGIPIRNIIAKRGDGLPIVVIGAHYDTRPRADRDPVDTSQPIIGANDGASGVAVLLELAQSLDFDKVENQVWLAFFDAEDVGNLTSCDLSRAQGREEAGCDTNPWDFSVGAEYTAANLSEKPAAIVIVDMVGDKDQKLYLEQTSDRELLHHLWDIADRLGFGTYFLPEVKWSITDDHTPFLKRGLRAVDIIDFDYPHWHTTADTFDKLSAASLEKVGRVLEVWLEQGRFE